MWNSVRPSFGGFGLSERILITIIGSVLPSEGYIYRLCVARYQYILSNIIKEKGCLGSSRLDLTLKNYQIIEKGEKDVKSKK